MQDVIKLQLEECHRSLKDYETHLQTIEQSWKIPQKTKRLREIAELEALDGFWQDLEKAQKTQQEKASLQEMVNLYSSLKTRLEDFVVLQDLAIEADDDDSAQEAINSFKQLGPDIDSALQKALLSGEHDSTNAIISINAGAGGTESCDWASMLYRMVIKWAEGQKFKLKTIDFLAGETAGLKSVTLLVEGSFAYGLLKSESGVHRLVRISPFDSNARRHTSFASVFVSPELDDSIEIEILDKELRIDVYRSGGAGGQSVNTADSAVRITHLPTGIVVACQNERSQLQNRALAMKILRSKLYERALEEQRAKQEAFESSKTDIAWGHQIRSYVLHPYKLVKDHRTQFEVSTPDKVLDGDLDDFINAYLKMSMAKSST